MIEICRFDPLQAKPSHEGTILADDVVPPSLHPPFEHAYGYLLNNRSCLLYTSIIAVQGFLNGSGPFNQVFRVLGNRADIL